MTSTFQNIARFALKALKAGETEVSLWLLKTLNSGKFLTELSFQYQMGFSNIGSKEGTIMTKEPHLSGYGFSLKVSIELFLAMTPLTSRIITIKRCK